MIAARPAPAHIPTRAELIDELTCRVQAEYREMPGLCLTLRQAQRLWGVDTEIWASVFGALTARGILRKAANGGFVRVRN